MIHIYHCVKKSVSGECSPQKIIFFQSSNHLSYGDRATAGVNCHVKKLYCLLHFQVIMYLSKKDKCINI